MSKLKDYYQLYELSQERMNQEYLISDSLLHSIISELKRSDVQFIADVIGYYYKEETKRSWKKQFFAKMEEHFFNGVQWEFDSILAGGYERYYYSVDFKMNGIKYALTIPNPKNITIENITDVYFGRYVLKKNTNGCVWSGICYSYDVNEIAETIKKEYENEKE